jgi:hypothetical protein
MFSTDTINSIFNVFYTKNIEKLKYFFQLQNLLNEDLYVVILELEKKESVKKINKLFEQAILNIEGLNTEEVFTHLNILKNAIKKSFIEGEFVEEDVDCNECTAQSIIECDIDDECPCCLNTGMMSYRFFRLTNQSDNSIMNLLTAFENNESLIKKEISMNFINQKNNQQSCLHIEEVNKYLTIKDF